MEKTIGGKTYQFKNNLFIFERNEFLKYQKLLERSESLIKNADSETEDLKRKQYTEVDFMFDVFPIFCLSIKDGDKDIDKKDFRDHIMRLDMDEFTEISVVLGDLMNELSNSEKKKN